MSNVSDAPEGLKEGPNGDSAAGAPGPDGALGPNGASGPDGGAGADKSARRRRIAAIALVSAACAGGWTVWDAVWAGRSVGTDDAYAAAEISSVTAAVGGIVESVEAVDTQEVRAGVPLVVLDASDAKLALESAEADLDAAERRVRSLREQDAGLTARVAARAADRRRGDAQMEEASAKLRQAEADLNRRRTLVEKGWLSEEAFLAAKTARDSARASLEAARAASESAKSEGRAAEGDRGAVRARIEGTDLESNPEVKSARVRRDQARLDLERTVIRAPVDGIVAKRTVQAGQKIAPGAQLMAVVPTASIHVDANFKESQLARVRIGQPAEAVCDLDGRTYHGKVAGIAGGTGAAFAAIPAQNATGNWIKVVQRLPVRIELDWTELVLHPLRVGLSMSVVVRTDDGRDVAAAAELGSLIEGRRSGAPK